MACPASVATTDDSGAPHPQPPARWPPPTVVHGEHAASHHWKGGLPSPLQLTSMVPIPVMRSRTITTRSNPAWSESAHHSPMLFNPLTTHHTTKTLKGASKCTLAWVSPGLYRPEEGRRKRTLMPSTAPATCAASRKRRERAWRPRWAHGPTWARAAAQKSATRLARLMVTCKGAQQGTTRNPLEHHRGRAMNC